MPDDFCDSVLLTFIYSEALGGQRRTSDGALLLPASSIPSLWAKWAGCGLIRLQKQTEDLQVVYFPYYFAQRYFKSRITVIDARHLKNLFYHIRSRAVDESKGKGYCFQMALALELSLGACWENSLLHGVLRQIDKDLVAVSLRPPPPVVGTFQNDKEAEDQLDIGRLCVSIDPTTKEKKLGDIAFLANLHHGDEAHPW